MTFDIEFTEPAEAEIDEIYFWNLGRSPERAEAWRSGLMAAIDSLRQFPTRCPVIEQSAEISYSVRRHRFGKYIILFSILDLDRDGVEDTVRVLQVRHGARLDSRSAPADRIDQ